MRVEARLRGYQMPQCNHCGEWTLRIWVEETEEVPGMRAWVECTSCKAEQSIPAIPRDFKSHP